MQWEIDQHIVASTRADRAHLHLHRSMVPHYDNLPDISHLVCNGITHARGTPADDEPSSVTIDRQASLLIRQCTPLRRRTRRAQREVMWQPESLSTMRTIVRCTQGTLLNLYPRSSRHVAYAWRTSIYALLRTLLALPFDKLNRCLSRIRYVCKICLMEHLCNTVADYHPGLKYVLNNGIEQVSLFTHGVTTMCDAFRGEINTAFDANGGDALRAMDALEPIAHSMFERCTRSFRGMILCNDSVDTPPTRRRTQPTPGMPLYRMVCSAHAAPTRYVFDAVHATSIPEAHLENVWRLVRNIQIFDLPSCVRQGQLAALQRVYGLDTQHIDAARWMHVCVFCALRFRDSRPNHTYLSSAKFRYDCETGELLCKSWYACPLAHLIPHLARPLTYACGSRIPSVVRINMVGRIMTLNDTAFVMTCCCASIVEYSGTGLEFHPVCGAHCAKTGEGRPKVRLCPHTLAPL